MNKSDLNKIAKIIEEKLGYALEESSQFKVDCEKAANSISYYLAKIGYGPSITAENCLHRYKRDDSVDYERFVCEKCGHHKKKRDSIRGRGVIPLKNYRQYLNKDFKL